MTVSAGAVRSISQFAFKAVVFVALYLVLKILLRLTFRILDHVMQLPVLSLINRVLGAACGLCGGLLYIWIAMLLISILPSVGICRAAMEQINSSSFLLQLYRSDILIRFIAGILS